jgi:hypothetical protein
MIATRFSDTRRTVVSSPSRSRPRWNVASSFVVVAVKKWKFGPLDQRTHGRFVNTHYRETNPNHKKGAAVLDMPEAADL